MTNIEQLFKKAEDEIVELLTRGIEDPLGRNRSMGRFVDHGRQHHDGKTPRILVKRDRTLSNNFNGIGDDLQDLDESFMILIEVAPSAGGVIRGERKTGSELLNLLTGQASRVMQDNVRPYNNNANSVIKQIQRLASGKYDWNPETNVHFCVLLYQVYIINDDDEL